MLSIEKVKPHKWGRLVKELFAYGLQNAGIAASGPVTAVLNVTKRCNSACEYCAIWKQSPAQDPPLGDIIRVLSQLAGEGVIQVSLSGGEPTLRPDLPDIVLAAKRLGMTVNISTNGTSLSYTLATKLAAAGLDFAVISLDTLDEGMYRSIRGISSSRVMEALDMLTNSEFLGKGLIPTVSCVLSAVNVEQAPSLVRALSDKNLYTGFQPFHSYPTTPAEVTARYSFSPHDARRLKLVVAELVQMKIDGSLIASSASYLEGIPGFLLEGKGPDRCTAGFFSTHIDERLNVRSCWLMPPIGELEKSSFRAIWCSRKYRRVRRRMLRKDCLDCWLRCHTEQPFPWRMRLGEFGSGVDLSALKRQYNPAIDI